MRAGHHRPEAHQARVGDDLPIGHGLHRAGRHRPGIVVPAAQQDPLPVAVIAVEVQDVVFAVGHGAGALKALRVRIQVRVIEQGLILQGADLKIARLQGKHLARLGLVPAEIHGLLRVDQIINHRDAEIAVVLRLLPVGDRRILRQHIGASIGPHGVVKAAVAAVGERAGHALVHTEFVQVIAGIVARGEAQAAEHAGAHGACKSIAPVLAPGADAALPGVEVALGIMELRLVIVEAAGGVGRGRRVDAVLWRHRHVHTVHHRPVPHLLPIVNASRDPRQDRVIAGGGLGLILPREAHALARLR